MTADKPGPEGNGIDKAAQPYIDLNFSDDSWLSRRSGPPEYHTGLLLENALYRIVEHGDWHRFPYHYRNDDGSFGLSFESLSDSLSGSRRGGADRSELIVVPDDAENGLGYGKRRYVRMRFKFLPESESPTNWTLIFQVHQNSQAGVSPPLALHIATDTSDSIVLELRARSDSNLETDGTVVWRQPIERGDWQDIILQLQPMHESGDGSGQVAVWHGADTERSAARPATVYRSAWGYTPGGEHGMEDKFNIRVGTYRAKQHRTMTVIFDAVRFGPTAASVRRDATPR